MKIRVLGVSIIEKGATWKDDSIIQINLACGHTARTKERFFNATLKNKKWPCEICEAMRRNRK